jgi:hypothetical protein
VKTSPHQDAADLVAECLRPDGLLPVNAETVARLTAAVQQQAKALSEAEAERDDVRLQFAASMQEFDIRNDELATAEARLTEAMKHLTILADDMGDVVEAQYVDRKDYPSEARRYERDIAPVRAARSFLNSASNKEPR